MEIFYVSGLLAAMADNLEALQLLINHSGKLSYTNAQSPLYYATSNANIAMVRYLLDSGADVHSPIIIYSYNPKSDKVLIQKYGEQIAVALMGVPYCTTPALISKGCTKDKRRAYEEIAKLFLKRGVNIHYENDSAMKDALSLRSIKILQLLLDFGFDINKQYASPGGSFTPLHSAVFQAQIDDDVRVVKFLLDNGADKHTKSQSFALDYFKDERTAWGLRKQNEHVWVVESAILWQAMHMNNHDAPRFSQALYRIQPKYANFK